MNTTERVRELVEPLLSRRDLELIDVEHGRGLVRVTVDRDGGVDLETLSQLTREVSRLLDEADPVAGRYTLEVSSPGLERPLRTPSQFRRAVGEQVKIKLVPDVDPERRVTGTLDAADDHGVTVLVDGPGEPAERRLSYDDIERARTVFDWGPPPKPGSGSKPGRQKQKKRVAR